MSVVLYYATLRGLKLDGGKEAPAATAGQNKKGNANTAPASASDDVGKLKAKISSLEVRVLILQQRSPSPPPQNVSDRFWARKSASL